MLRSEWLLLFGSLLVAGALYNHYMGHSALLIEILMVGAGSAIALFACRSLLKSSVASSEGLLYDLLSRYLKREHCRIFIPFSGFAIILLWSLWKIVFLEETNLRMEDIIVTLLGLALILYSSDRSALAEVKDFIALYLMFLAIVFVIIWRTYSLVTGESHYRITAYAEYYLITAPVVWLLRAFGFEVNAILDIDGIGLSNIIEYEHNDSMSRVAIGVGCSGLYSAGLFFSAFLAFVIARYRQIDGFTLVGLTVGFATTWFSNVVRMVITVWAGIMWGHPALATVHSYIGIIVFVAFVTVFWVLIVRWLDEKRPSTALRTNRMQGGGEAEQTSSGADAK